MITVKDLNDVRNLIQDLKYSTMESLIEHIEDSTEFERGQYKGNIQILEEIDLILRNSLKYREDVE